MSSARKGPEYQQENQDRLRDREIYRYLFSLAVVYKGEADNLDIPENINFSQTGKRFGEKADYARRIYNFITNQDHDSYNQPAKITTAELVKRLKILSENLEPGAIRREAINQLFGYLISLTHEEREDLHISKSEADILIQHSLLNIRSSSQNTNNVLHESILELYKSSLDLQTASDHNSNFEDKAQLNDFIQKTIANHLDTLGFSGVTAEKQKYKYKYNIERRIHRIIAKSSLSQVKSKDSENNIPANYFTPKFIKNLAITTIENELIRDKIPLYLEYIDIKQIEPLPLLYSFEGTSDDIKFLFNKKLKLDNFEILSHDASLLSLYAHQVSIDFRLKITKETENELKQSKDIPDQVKNRLFKPNKKSGIIFKVDSTGVGTQLSQVMKIINRALFWDVKCIEESYSNISHDLVHETMGNQIDGPVWSHSLVRLCRLEYLEQALRNKEKKKYIDYAHVEEIGRGDYLGFDLIEASAKSSLQARLGAILQTNIHPERYKKDLIQTIIRREILRVSDDFLDYYPFSLNAMEGFLKEYQYLEENSDDKKERMEDNNQQIYKPSLYYDAYLNIIKAYLREGLYCKAKGYFDTIQNLEEISQKNLSNFRPDLSSAKNQEHCKIFSGGTLAKYELLKAYYLYLFDENETEARYRWQGIDDHRKTNLISKAWDALNNASYHLQIRIAKYDAIDEISQAIFSPYFITLAHINFRKAKLFLYFPTDSANRFPSIPELQNYSYGRLYFFEQARLCAAKHGNQVTYAIYTSLEVWAYIMAGYLENKILTFSSSKSIDLTRETCLEWAKKLRDQALISYTEYGLECYYQIKEKSGISEKAVSKLPKYGPVTIAPVPLIREERSDSNDVEQGYGYFKGDLFEDDNILRIDMALLHMKQLDDSDELLEESIYLFGTKAAKLLSI